MEEQRSVATDPKPGDLVRIGAGHIEYRVLDDPEAGLLPQERDFVRAERLDVHPQGARATVVAVIVIPRQAWRDLVRFAAVRVERAYDPPLDLRQQPKRSG